MDKMIKVARHRSFAYVVNYPASNGSMKTYNWTGSKGKKVDIKEIPQEVVDYLLMNSSCFRQGELAIIEDNEIAKEAVENIDNVEDYKNNSQSKEDVIKLLEGNHNKMKAELKKVTNKDQMKFIVDTAKEIKLDSSSKLKFISEWFGVPQDILFSDED